MSDDLPSKIELSVAVFLTNTQNELLMVQRRKDLELPLAERRGWDIISGGKKKRDAHLVNHAKREASEECGRTVFPTHITMLSATNLGIISCAFLNRDANKEGFCKLILGVTAQLDSKAKITPTEEITAQKFFGLGQLPAQQLPEVFSATTNPLVRDRLVTHLECCYNAQAELVEFEMRNSKSSRGPVAYKKLSQRPLSLAWLESLGMKGYLTHLHPINSIVRSNLDRIRYASTV